MDPDKYRHRFHWPQAWYKAPSPILHEKIKHDVKELILNLGIKRIQNNYKMRKE